MPDDQTLAILGQRIERLAKAIEQLARDIDKAFGDRNHGGERG